MSAQRVISVFGGSGPQEGTAAYEQARQLGRLLAEGGFVVATGGYTGVMAAASRGAHEAGGHVIGVTCERIERYATAQFASALRANRWVTEEIRYATLRERLYHLVANCGAAVALPGGIGTLSEIALTWSLLQTGEIEPKPLILVDQVWHDTFTAFLQHADGYVRAADRALIVLAEHVPAAVRRLLSELGPASQS